MHHASAKLVMEISAWIKVSSTGTKRKKDRERKREKPNLHCEVLIQVKQLGALHREEKTGKDGPGKKYYFMMFI